MPSVVIKEGIPIFVVMIPFTSPINNPAIIPMMSAITGFNPALSFRIAMMKGASAKVDPTERSNSPEIISIVIPIATIPSSGIVLIIIKRFSVDKNFLFIIENIDKRTIVIMTILISLFLSMFFNWPLFIKDIAPSI